MTVERIYDYGSIVNGPTELEIPVTVAERDAILITQGVISGSPDLPVLAGWMTYYFEDNGWGWVNTQYGTVIMVGPRTTGPTKITFQSNDPYSACVAVAIYRNHQNSPPRGSTYGNMDSFPSIWQDDIPDGRALVVRSLSYSQADPAFPPLTWPGLDDGVVTVVRDVQNASPISRAIITEEWVADGIADEMPFHWAQPGNPSNTDRRVLLVFDTTLYTRASAPTDRAPVGTRLPLR